MKAFGSLVTLTVLLTISAHAQARKLEVIPYTHADNEQAYLDLGHRVFRKDFKPDTVAEWLEGRLPRPVDDVNKWLSTE